MKRSSIGVVASFLGLLALPAVAAVPTTGVIEGALTSSGGGAAADGSHDGTFAI